MMLALRWKICWCLAAVLRLLLWCSWLPVWLGICR